MNTLTIATACLLSPEQHLLLVRKRDSSFWMLPGGKLDAGETALQALLRELGEELQWNAENTTFQTLGSFENQAANEANTRVQAQVFYAQLSTVPQLHIDAEIEAMQWWPLNSSHMEHFAPLLQEQVIPNLRQVLRSFRPLQSAIEPA